MKIENILSGDINDSVKEIRKDTDNYTELVLLSKGISSLNKVLSGKFGVPVVLEDGKELECIEDNEKQVKILADSLGGVRKGQSIYYGTHDSFNVMVMMWPWQDKNHVTLKKFSYNEDLLHADERRIYQRRALRERRRLGSKVKPKCPNRRYRMRRIPQERRFMPLFLIRDLNKKSDGDA